MISGPGVVSARPSPSSISPGVEPVAVLHRLLRHVGEHRVGAAEGHHRHLAEEDRQPGEGLVRAERQHQRRDRHEPGEREPGRRAPGAAAAGLRVGRRLGAEQRIGVGEHRRRRRRDRRRCRRSAPERAPSQPSRPATRTISGNGTSKAKIATKAAAAIAWSGRLPSARRPMRTTAWTHDGEHRRLEPEEEAGEQVGVAVGDVDRAQRHHRDEAGQHEEEAGHQAAAHAVHAASRDRS